MRHLPFPILPPFSALAAAALVAGPAQAQFFSDQAAAYDYFGSAVAVGDFDGNGFPDLAVGIPGEDRTGASGCGAVRIYFGGAAGFLSGGQEYWAEGVGGFPSLAGIGDKFGTCFAVGDFDGDGVDDLAIGAPGKRVGSSYGAGAVFVLPGIPGIGPVPSWAQVFHQDTAGVQGRAEPGDAFGSALAAGDLNGDGVCDLAIGVPRENIGSTKIDAGAVNVLFGSAEIGLTGVGDQLRYGVYGISVSYDHMGSSLVIGDFDGNGVEDLAIGVPGYDTTRPDFTPAIDAGAVVVVSSLPITGPSGYGELFLPAYNYEPGWQFTQGATFGTALAAGDYDADGIDDLAIGSPGENTELLGVVVPDAGVVHVLYGSSDGLEYSGHPRFHQNTPGIGGVAEPGDRFGAALATGRFDFTGLDALAIGARGEDIGTVSDAGAAHVLYYSGSTHALSAIGSQIWYQNVGGIEGTSGAYDGFGAALAAGDVTGDGIGDLVLGVPGEDVAGYNRAGSVGILRGAAENGIVAANDYLIHEYVWNDNTISW